MTVSLHFILSDRERSREKTPGLYVYDVCCVYLKVAGVLIYRRRDSNGTGKSLFAFASFSFLFFFFLLFWSKSIILIMEARCITACEWKLYQQKWRVSLLFNNIRNGSCKYEPTPKANRPGDLFFVGKISSLNSVFFQFYYLYYYIKFWCHYKK